MSGRPLDVLEASLGEDVIVRLKGGEMFEGVLTGYDQHMNLVLEEVSVDDDSAEAEVYGETTIIRGDNLVSIVT